MEIGTKPTSQSVLSPKTRLLCICITPGFPKVKHMFTIIASAVCLASSVNIVSQTYVPSGLIKKTGLMAFAPIKTSSESKGIKVKPTDLKNPSYGSIAYGGKSFGVIIDKQSDEVVRLYVDTNGDEDLTKDEVKLAPKKRGTKTFLDGVAKVNIGMPENATVEITIDPKAALAYCAPDFGFDLQVTLDGKKMKGLVLGYPSKQNPVILDLNQDGDVLNDLDDAMPLDEPFNYTGTTYIFKSEAGKLSLATSDQKVEKVATASEIAKQAALFKSTLDWNTNYKTALDLSEKTGKPILIDFTGSDWCGWCIKLKNEVFKTTKFEEWAKKNVILLELDYPQNKPQSDEIKAQNKELAKKFQIKGYPTILFIDSKEKVLGTYGYDKGGPDVWTKKADDMIKKGS